MIKAFSFSSKKLSSIRFRSTSGQTNWSIILFSFVVCQKIVKCGISTSQSFILFFAYTVCSKKILMLRFFLSFRKKISTFSLLKLNSISISLSRFVILIR